MTLPRPTVRLTIDGAARSAPEAALGAVQVDLGLAGTHDRVLVTLSRQSPFADAEVGASFALALGYGDDLTDVITGTVVAVETVAGGLVVEALAATSALSEAYVGQPYVRQSIADIVSDLISQAGASAGEIEAPLVLHAYHVDERRAVWSHLIELARLGSCDLGADATGAVVFRPVRQGTSDHRLRHGAELLAWSIDRRAPGPAAIAVVPYGAASESGNDAWRLVLREPDGSPPTAPTAVHAALRDRDGAKALADGLGKRRDRRKVGGHLLVVGDAAVRAGDLVEVSDLPEGDPGLLRAVAVRHLLDAEAGFVSRIQVEAAS